MNINEASDRTGLSKKTLRFYEDKGLFSTERKDNAYREYSEELIGKILRIKALRAVDVSISDILLWQNGMISLESLIKTRLKTLREDRLNNSQQLEMCRTMLENCSDWNVMLQALRDSELASGKKTEDTDSGFRREAPVTVGIDIGTSTISLVVVNRENASEESYNIPNNSAVPGGAGYKTQDPEKMISEVTALLDMVKRTYPNISAIGVTGQMHGILYLDCEGHSVSPLYTWQDKSGDRIFNGEGTYCDEAYRRTGIRVPTGYGLLTHFCLTQSGEIPGDGATICTVMDYACMRLTGRKKPLMHAINAASLGYFDLRTMDFDREALCRLGVDISVLPEVVNSAQQVGLHDGRIPVYTAIGDHQASFLGATAGSSEDAVLINIGTGSQISVVCDNCCSTDEGIEIRPYFNGKFLKCYSALCGGYAYALTERFMRAVIQTATGEEHEQYGLLEKLAKQCGPEVRVPEVCTAFCGTRLEPDKTGSITGITADNFLPGYFVNGVMHGMIKELYDAYVKMDKSNSGCIIASGNAVRKNSLLCAVIEEYFGSKPAVSDLTEESAVGAALFASNAISEQ